MSARKTKAARAPARRKSAKVPARAPGPTRAQQAARRRIIAASGVVITRESREKLRRELRELLGD
jgi:hypothetical protein